MPPLFISLTKTFCCDIIFECKKQILRGVAQMVARLVWDQDAAGSNPVTPTSREPRHALSRTEVLFLFQFLFTRSTLTRYEHSHHIESS